MTFIHNKSQNSRFWDYLIVIIRFWGVFTAVASVPLHLFGDEQKIFEEEEAKCAGAIATWKIDMLLIMMCGVGVDVLAHHYLMGLCLMLGSLAVLFLEMTWAVTHFLKTCVRDEASRVFVVWNAVLCVKHWRKSLMYLSLSAVLLLKFHGTWPTFVAGGMLISLALLHFLSYFKPQGNKIRLKRHLLPNGDGRSEEDIFEVLDNHWRPKEETVVDEPGGNVLEI